MRILLNRRLIVMDLRQKWMRLLLDGPLDILGLESKLDENSVEWMIGHIGVED